MFAEALEAQGFSVWWDVGLRTGEAYDEVTERALRTARSVVVLWSKKSVISRWVRAEATLAQRIKTLFPCMIEPCDRPIMFELTQTADLTYWRGARDDHAWLTFVAELRRFIEASPVAPGDKTDAPSMPANTVIAPVPPRKLIALNRRNLFIAGGGALAVCAAGVAFFNRGGAALAANGVAVLPFRNLSGNPDEDYLSIGLSSEVRSVLARNQALRVVAQASCEAVKKRALGAAEMARTLAVTFLLDGNVARTGDSLRVAAELIDGRTGFSRWTETFERPIEELATVQQAIADAVTVELAIDMGEPASSEGFGATGNAAAFNDYLKGKQLYAVAANLESDLAALAMFDRAIERDPDFGAAYAARARSLTSLGNTADSVAKAREYYANAHLSARRAVEISPSSADAYSTLGLVLFQAQLRVAAAREPYEKSYELGQGEAAIMARYAGYAAATRQSAAAEQAAGRARDLDPLNATIHRAYGFVQYAAGRYPSSIEAVKRAIALNPDLSDSHARIGMALIALGKPDEALEAAKSEKSALMRLPCLAIAHHRLGDAAAADMAMGELVSAYGDAGLYQQAQVLSARGEIDEAVSVLARANDLGDSGLTYALIDPTLDPLRDRPEFGRLLKGLGFV